MKHTRETVRRHLSPWVLLIWVVLIGLAALLDHSEVLPSTYFEEHAE
jgi:hypothetical protein